MVKKSKKSKSKRMPLRKKYKIMKKVKEHHKKKAKEAKKAEGKKKHFPEKDPGIPNSWPFKEQELAALEARRQRAIEEIEKKKQEKKERQAKRRAGLLPEVGPSQSEELALAELARQAKKRDAEFDKRKRQKIVDKTGTQINDGSRRAFYKEFQKVIDASDVIIQVLDVRDPMACRCPEVERLVIKSGAHKRVILLLNKIDLVPRDVVQKWLKYFREELPTVAFKCSTQSQGSNLGQVKGGLSSGGGPPATSQTLGADTLLQLLKNYARNQKLKTSVTVGVIGFPNVGKSSLINSLKRSRVANVGSTPGVTKAMQEIHLDKHVKLLDCPGIVFSSSQGPEAALRNAVKIEQLVDPITPVTHIVKLCQPDLLMSIYKIAKFADADEFIRLVAVARGKLKRGGIPDPSGASKLILKDWNEGKIPYYTMPPERTENLEHEESSVVSSWAKEFDVDAVFGNEESALLPELIEGDEGDFARLPAGAPPSLDMASFEDEDSDQGEEEEDEEGDDDEEKDNLPTKMEEDGVEVKHRGREYLNQTEKLYDADGIFNNKLAKAEKKRRKKAGKLANGAAALSEDKMDADDDDEGSDYDFRVDYRGGGDVKDGDDADSESEDSEGDDEEEDEGENNGDMVEE